MLKLLVESTRGQEATILVRWCLSRDGLRELQDKDIRDPRVLLVTRNVRSGAERRWIVPLQQVMQHVTFHDAGDNILFGCIVWDEERGKLWERYLKQQNGVFRNAVINPETLDWSLEGCALFPTKRDVSVAAGFFAPKLSAWEQKWLTFVIGTPMTDQCATRARRMFAYTLQPVLVAIAGIIGYAVTLCCSVFVLLMAYEKIEWRNMLQWGKTREHLVCDYSPSSRFDRWYLWPIAPMTLVMTPVALILINQVLSSSNVSSFISTWRQLGGWTAATLGMFYVVTAFAMWVMYLEDKAPQWRTRRAAEMPAHYLDVQELLACEGDEKPVALNALPVWRRPIRLSFQGVKREVCRPYAQSR